MKTQNRQRKGVEMVTVVNKHMVNVSKLNSQTDRFEYIGRPSILGNPFAVGRDGTRADVIAKYRLWLWRALKTDDAIRRRIWVLAKLHMEGVHVHLACWCKPKSCHGDVIRSAVLWAAEQATERREKGGS